MTGIEVATGELMNNSKPKMHIEKIQYKTFLNRWSSGHFMHQRFGQAFYNYFSLHKLADQDRLLGLYEKDGVEAMDLVNQLFEFM